MYSWLVALHLLGLAAFLLAHGVSIWVAFRIRREANRDVVRAMLEVSQQATGIAYIGLVALGIGGLGAAWSAGLLTATWIVASYVVVVVVLGAMYSIASPYYQGLRQALAGTADSPAADDVTLAGRLQTRRPEALAAFGGLGLVALILLMTLKPG